MKEVLYFDILIDILSYTIAYLVFTVAFTAIYESPHSLDPIIAFFLLFCKQDILSLLSSTYLESKSLRILSSTKKDR